MFAHRLIYVCLAIVVGILTAVSATVVFHAAHNRATVQSLLRCDDASVLALYGDYKYIPPPTNGVTVYRGGQRVHGFSVFGEPSPFERLLAPMFGLHAFTEIYAVYWEDESTTDQDLRLLARVPNLRELHLNHANITDTGISSIVRLRQLTVLDISSTHITDAGIRQLSACANLRELDLSGTPVNDSLAQELKRALPSCDIFW